MKNKVWKLHWNYFKIKVYARHQITYAVAYPIFLVSNLSMHDYYFYGNLREKIQILKGKLGGSTSIRFEYFGICIL